MHARKFVKTPYVPPFRTEREISIAVGNLIANPDNHYSKDENFVDNQRSTKVASLEFVHN